MSRNKARVIAMQTLYLHAARPEAARSMLKERAREEELEGKDLKYLERIVQQAVADQARIDKWIEDLAIDWDLNRIARVDLAILRLAIAEMVHDEEIPPQIAINEAVKIAKKYAEAESSKFINGILGKFAREILPALTPDSEAPPNGEND